MIGASSRSSASETSFFLKRPALEDDLDGDILTMVYH